jgi:prefoldin subunit 5
MESSEEDHDTDDSQLSERLENVEEAIEETKQDLEKAYSKVEEGEKEMGLIQMVNILTAQVSELLASTRLIRRELVELRSEIQDADPAEEAELDSARIRLFTYEERLNRIRMMESKMRPTSD